MAILTIRNVPAEVHRALRVRAAAHGRSTEAEIRDILENCVKPEQRLRMGDALSAIGQRAGLKDKLLNMDIIERRIASAPALEGELQAARKRMAQHRKSLKLN